MMDSMQQTTLQQHHRRGRSLSSSSTAGNERDEDLVLFHEMQKRERLASHKSVVQPLQRPPPTITPPKSKGSEDIFSSPEWDKNDYDWLLTPPTTPLVPSLDHELAGHGFSLSGTASSVRSMLKTTSRLGNSRSEPPSRAEPSSRIVCRNLGIQPPKSANAALLSSITSRAEPSSRIVCGNLGIQQPKSASASLLSSTNSISQRSFSSSSNGTLRPSKPSSSVMAHPSMPVSQPLARPSTPNGSARAPRVSTSSTSTRPSTPTGRPTISSSRPASSSSRPSTPVKRPSTPTRTSNPPNTLVRSTSVNKASSVPIKSAASSRPSSPTTRARQPAAHPAALPGFSQEPPPNLRTSMADRPLSNSRGSLASTAGGTAAAKATQLEAADAGAQNRRLSSSPLVTRGRLSSDSLNGDKSIIRNGKPHDAALGVALSNGIGSKMVDRTMPTRKPIPSFQEKQSTVVNSQLKKPVKSTPLRDVKSTTSSVRESSGFGRNLSKKSLDMALRHMDIRKSTPSGFRSFMSNVPASSLYSVRSGNGRGLSTSSVTDSPMATSSNASSEHSMSIVIDPEGSEVGDGTFSEKGSKASPVSQPDPSFTLSNERRVSSWLVSPAYVDDSNADIIQIFEQGIERLSITESPLVSQQEGTIECDNLSLEPIQ